MHGNGGVRMHMPAPLLHPRPPGKALIVGRCLECIEIQVRQPTDEQLQLGGGEQAQGRAVAYLHGTPWRKQIGWAWRQAGRRQAHI